MNVEVQTEGEIKIIKRLEKGVKVPIRRAVFLTTNFFETRARKNLDNVIYRRAVPWERSRKARQSIVGNMLDSMTGRVTMGVRYGKIIEDGSKPHVITPKRAKFLVFNSGGRKVFAHKVNHPGTKPYPFWGPAVKATRAQAPIILREELKKAV